MDETDGVNSKFDISIVLVNFKKCKAREDGGICLDSYMSGYNELCKFFGLLGAVFSFVGSDVQQKLVQLECLRKGGAGDNYVTVQQMMRWEIDTGLLQADRDGNGCRTLLRLHRALAFIMEFLRELHDRPDEHKMGPVCQHAYRRTLAHHHAWLVQKAATLAMYTLGTRNDIVSKAVGDAPHERERGREILLQCVDIMQQIYDEMQQLYEERGLSDLP